MQNNPIGVFDSGIGGLTVVKELLKTLPGENIVYVGDTARVPYGTRSEPVITKFALELTRFLIHQKVKILVIACNTISAVSLKAIESISTVPVLGVIKPAINRAVKLTKNKKIGVICTRATLESGIYERETKRIEKKIKIVAQACPLFVPLVEEGLINHPATKLIAREYFIKLKSEEIDTLILGCTHYPLLREIIQHSAGKNVALIDSAKPTAEEVKKILIEKKLLNKQKNPLHNFFLTDVSKRSDQIINLFFDNKFPGHLKKINL